MSGSLSLSLSFSMKINHLYIPLSPRLYNRNNFSPTIKYLDFEEINGKGTSCNKKEIYLQYISAAISPVHYTFFCWGFFASLRTTWGYTSTYALDPGKTGYPKNFLLGYGSTLKFISRLGCSEFILMSGRLYFSRCLYLTPSRCWGAEGKWT